MQPGEARAGVGLGRGVGIKTSYPGSPHPQGLASALCRLKNGWPRLSLCGKSSALALEGVAGFKVNPCAVPPAEALPGVRDVLVSVSRLVVHPSATVLVRP